MIKANLKKLIIVMIVLLVSLNIWRWWPDTSTRSNKLLQKSGVFNIEDFEVKATTTDLMKPMSRDIFQAKRVVRKKAMTKLKPPTVHAAPVKSGEEIAKENAEAEFSKIRCVGISIRNERIQAYVLNAGEPFLISTGDKVGSRFVVEKITQDGATLRDPVTGVGGLISISGK